MVGSDHTALVTGGGRGIGQTIALELAERGADIVIADLNPDEMAETRKLVESRGQRAVPLETDLRDESSVAETIDRALSEFDALEILVNNAGIAGPTLPCEEMPVDEWDNTLAVNLRGTFLMCRGLLPAMKRAGYGRIVNISSVTAKRPVPNRTPYAASKAGLIGFTRSLAAEVGEHDINVNVICPGSVEGPRIERVFENHADAKGVTRQKVKEHELGESARHELVDPRSVAQLVAFLCSEGADQMTGQDLNVSAGKVMY